MRKNGSQQTDLQLYFHGIVAPFRYSRWLSFRGNLLEERSWRKAV